MFCPWCTTDSQNLAKRTISDKILKDKTFEITRNHNYDGYKRALATILYKFFDKKTGSRIKSDSNKQNGNKSKWTISWRIT